MSKNVRLICGNLQFRRFAYLHKKDYAKFGLLEAVNYEDARNHLGGSFHIKQTWLSEREESDQSFDRQVRFEIVWAMFSEKLSNK